MSGRRTRGFLGVTVALAFLAGACAGPRPAAVGSGGAGAGAPAAPAPGLPRLVPSPKPGTLGVVERYAWQTVEQLGDALARGETEGFLGKVSNGFYKGYSQLEGALRDLVGRTESRAVVVAVRAVEVEGERVSVRAEWTSEFVHREGETASSAGETTFLFLRSDTALRLIDYRGDPPFGIPGL